VIEVYIIYFPFSNFSPENLEDYDFALENASTIIKFSSVMLNKVNNEYNIERIKRWTLLPIASHRIERGVFSFKYT
jgi:hypothetical protein